MIGQVLDARYRILSLLGEGGMGRVFLAEHVGLGSRVALKVVHEQYAREDAVMKRFQQEAIAASRIRHENIVSVTDFGRTGDGALYFVMEYLEGQSLAHLIRTCSPVPLERAVRILLQLSRAMRAAHEAGIIHRDLKPENVWLVPRDDEGDLVKVLDFGISQVTTQEPGAERLTLAGMIMGTPEYMSPEQGAAIEVDARSDIYSLGIIAYELLTGRVPFVSDSQVGVLVMHQTQAPAPPRELRPELPEALEAFVLRAIEKRPEHRQQEMDGVLRELSAAGLEVGVISGTPSLSPVARGELLTPGGGIPPPVAKEPSPKEPTPKPSTLLPLDAPLMAPRPSDSPTLAPAFAAARGETVELSARSVEVPAFVPPEPSASSRTRRLLALGAGVTLVLGAVGLLAFRGPPEPDTEPATTPHEAAAPNAAESNVPPNQRSAIRTVLLESEPPGAAVYEGTLRLGATPLEVSLSGETPATYSFTLEGHRTSTRTVEPHENGVKVKLTRSERTRKGGGSGGKEPPYEDLKPNPF